MASKKNQPTIKKSAAKRVRQNKKRRLRNASFKSRIKTLSKKVEKATEFVPADLNEAISTLAKAAQKGLMHANTVARRISRLTRAANSKKSAS